MLDLSCAGGRLLPVIPQHVLRKHRVFERHDNRFRACARYLQALWRERQGLPIGTHSGSHRQPPRIGSLIGAAAADAGRNFLTPQVAHLVRTESAFRERGAFIDQARLFGNLLSSMPLAFNLFAPLRFDHNLATAVMCQLFREVDIADVKQVLFEHSPGRTNAALTSDRTAFDVAVVYERSDHSPGFIGIEIKYTETMRESASSDTSGAFDRLAQVSNLFKEPASALLRVALFQQLFREHLLAQAALMRGDWAEATFCVIAPRHNHLVQSATRLYQTHLSKPGNEQVAFRAVDLGLMIDALARSGEQDYAYLLHDRYCDWWKLETAVEAALTEGQTTWSLVPPPRIAPLQLISPSLDR